MISNSYVKYFNMIAKLHSRLQMRISKTMSRSRSRPHTSFNDLVQDLKPVSKILFNTLFRISKTRLRSLSQDLKAISKFSLRTSKHGQDLKSVLKTSFKTLNHIQRSCCDLENKVTFSHSRPQTRDLV
jgi:hypothetical protein